MFKGLLARLVRSQRFQEFVANAASPGPAAALTRPEAPIFNEGVDAERRVIELEAERDALAQQLEALRQRIRELEERRK